MRDFKVEVFVDYYMLGGVKFFVYCFFDYFGGILEGRGCSLEEDVWGIEWV